MTLKKISIVTGASRGIGREIATRLAKEGHFVALVARNEEEIRELEFEIDSSGGKSRGYPIDLTDEAAVEAMVADLRAQFGRIDVLVNNAGIGIFKPGHTLRTEEWDRVFDVNVRGSFLMTKAVLPAMLEAKSGHIVAIASDVSKRTFANGSLYCASKYAQDAFFSGLRKEVRASGVKVSVVYPGLVDTFFHDGSPGQPHRAAYLQPHDIADSVAYILNAPAHVVIDELMIHPLVQEY
jgi:NADP-dependent 3-hydroxy acid dehydrogenase YdfG